MSVPVAVPRAIEVTCYEDLGHPDLDALWESVKPLGDTWMVFQELWWLRSWWEAFGRGQLRVLAAFARGRPVCIAPLFSDGGMVFLVGSGGSDYLDFIGSSEPGVLEALIDAALEQWPHTLGFRFYHVPDASRSGGRLRAAAGELGLVCYDEGTLPAPWLEIGAHGERALAAAGKKSLVRHERYFARDGGLFVRHLRKRAEIAPWLEAFFAQHERRWSGTQSPSLFADASHREFYRRLVDTAGEGGWLRFTVVEHHGRPVAFHFGFSHRGRYLWYKPSFDVDYARRSPGEVLLRQLLMAAVEEGAHTFDFGLGDEAFKNRFATASATVRTWGLYPVR